MLATVQHSIKDRSSTWGSALTPPPSFNIKAYQDNLNKIAGLTQQGEPVLRLTWGGDSTRIVATDWDSFGNPTDWARMARHAFESKKRETWGQLIPIRRWIIEENTDRGQIDAMGGKTLKNVEVPETGFYTPYIIIADHSKCKDCKADEFKCFGDYKAPGNEELLFLTEVTYKLTLSRKQDPRKGVDTELAAQITASETPDEEEEKALDEEENLKFVRSWLKTHKPIRSLPSEPRSLNHASSNNKPTSNI